MNSGKTREARDAAAKWAHYMPSASAQLTLGIADYTAGDKNAALSDFRKALQLDPNVKQRFTPGAAGGRGGNRLQPILEDRDFLKQLFPDQ
jgi:hypothetical protein